MDDLCTSRVVLNPQCFTPADWASYNAGLQHQAPMHVPYLDSQAGLLGIGLVTVVLTCWFTRTAGHGWHVTVPRFVLVTVPTFARNVARGVRAPR